LVNFIISQPEDGEGTYFSDTIKQISLTKKVVDVPQLGETTER